MAVKTAAQLAIDVVTDAKDTTAGFEDVTAGARDMERAVESAGTSAARSLNITADSADELGGKAGKATGALGALSSGFELLGPSGSAAAAGLQSAALATDFMSGVGDSLNLVMESTIVKNIRARAVSLAQAAATGVQSAATAVMTAGQWALNAAMSANPIALVVIAIVALAAAVVIAYKRSETFRRIVTAAFDAVQGAAQFAFNWVKDNWPLLLAIITGPIGLAVLAVVKNWATIREAVSATKKWITDRMNETATFLVGVGGRIKDALLAPFQAIADAVQKVLDLIDKIDVPDLPSLGDIGKGIGGIVSRVSGGSSSDRSDGGGGATYNYTFNISGILDADQAAAKIEEVLIRNSRLFGPVTVNAS